jgi:hypothetical protein
MDHGIYLVDWKNILQIWGKKVSEFLTFLISSWTATPIFSACKKKTCQCKITWFSILKTRLIVSN